MQTIYKFRESLAVCNIPSYIKLYFSFSKWFSMYASSSPYISMKNKPKTQKLISLVKK